MRLTAPSPGGVTAIDKEGPAPPPALLEGLFKPEPPPNSFQRKTPTAHIYAHYSRKLGRRCYCYGHLHFDLWILVESDPSILRYNERVPPTPMVGLDGQIKHVQTSIVSLTRSGEAQVHKIADSEERNDESASRNPQEMVVRTWARQNGLTAIIWNRQALHPLQLKISGLKQLLKYVSQRGQELDVSVNRLVEYVLGRHRVLTIGSVLSSLSDQDPDLVMRGIAEIVLSGRCYSDIDRFSLSHATELSVFNVPGTTN